MMRYGTSVACTCLLLLIALANTLAAANAEAPAGWGDFSIDLFETLSPPSHVFVGSGWSTVHPTPTTVMGVGGFSVPPVTGAEARHLANKGASDRGGFLAPPFACPNFQMDVALAAEGFGDPILDIGSLAKKNAGLLYAGSEWKPDRIIRRGTHHQLRKGKLLSLGVESELIPLFNRGGFLLKVNLTNRTEEPLDLSVQPSVQPGGLKLVPLKAWGFGIPGPGDPAKSVGDNVWSNGKVRLTLLTESCQMKLSPGNTGTAWLAVVASNDNDQITKPEKLAEWEDETAQAWSKRMGWALRSVPVMETDIPGLRDYYRRSIVSGLVCIWENPTFAINPHVATSGMDGGALCTYVWDIGGYSSEMMPLMLGEKCKPLLEQMAKIDFSKYYAFSLNGQGVGCSYSYSPFSFTNLCWGVCRHGKPDRQLYETAKKLVFDAEKKYPSRNGLLDYGEQGNLLEMRSMGYEHFVPSPNAERAWCFDRLADLGDQLGESAEDTKAWRNKAVEIRTAVKRELWDLKLGWFKCIYPDGHAERIYSIQMFDVLRTMGDDADIRNGLLAQLRPGAFLADSGVQSVSRADAVHFEMLDTDWSGGGAYIGDGAELAETLYRIGESDRAWDILQRYFWMGKRLLYYPQEVFADRPAVPAHKRANCNSGLVHAQAILYGLAGFDPRPDGSLWLDPHPPQKGRIALKGYRVHGHAVDVDFTDGVCRVVCDGDEVYRGPPKLLCIAKVAKD